MFLLLLSAGLAAPGGFATGAQAADSGAHKPHHAFVLPAINFSDDKGFGYGIFFQWDDTRSPRYQPYYLSHRIVIQRTTRGIALNYYRFDSPHLLPSGLRVTMDLRIQTSPFEPYHGPGGAQTLYNQTFADTASPDYQGKFYYMYAMRYMEMGLLVQGNVAGGKFRWLAGGSFRASEADTIDYAARNEDPTLQSLLARKWEQEAQGRSSGRELGLVVGLVHDSRDHETTPTGGIWSELLLRWVPRSPASDFDYTVLTGTHRHYVPLGRGLTLAYRIGGRVMSVGAPFVAEALLDGSFGTVPGLGGYRTVRGILWQRVRGRRLLYGNLELRYQVLPLWSSGYLAVSAYHDLGRSLDEAPAADSADRGEDRDRWHRSLGLGARVAPHATLVVALETGWALDPSMDGAGMRLYIDIDWMF